MSAPAEPVRVLHVDDDPNLTDLTATFVERKTDDVTVETATDADEIIDNVEELAFDCIVSDYDMPGTDGIEFLEAVREARPDLPFILFTGKGSEEVASEAVSAGVTDYLQKGTGTEQYELLCNRIENAVERYRTEERLRQTRERFRRIFQQSYDAIMILDPGNDEIRNANTRACELLGYDRQELLSLSPTDIHPHDVDQFKQFVDTVYEDETGWTNKLSCLTKEGSIVPIHVSASTIRIDGTRHMLALLRRLSDLPETNRDETLLRTLLDNSTDGIYVIDPETGTFLDANSTACRRLGYEREELLEMSVPDIAASGFEEPWDDHVDAFLESEWISEGLAHERKDGSTYPIAIKVKHVVLEEHRAYLIAIVRDTSDS